MMRTLLAGVLALALGACSLLPAMLGGLSAGPAPESVQTASAPLARTQIDETALRALWRSTDAIRASVDVLVARGVLVRNTPRALAVQSGLIALRESLVAADDLVAVLNAPVTDLSAAQLTAKVNEYRAAIRQAQAAYDAIAAAIRS